MEAECIFCNIVKKQVPAKVVYEDETIMAFLDINPLSLGHTLVIPKKHASNIFDIDVKDLQHLIEVAKKLSERIKIVVGADGINLINSNEKAAGQEIPHFHLHIIPRKENDDFKLREVWFTTIKKFEESTMEKTAELIRSALVEEEKEKVEEIEKEEEKPRSEEEVFWIKRELELA